MGVYANVSEDGKIPNKNNVTKEDPKHPQYSRCKVVECFEKNIKKSFLIKR